MQTMTGVGADLKNDQLIFAQSYADGRHIEMAPCLNDALLSQLAYFSTIQSEQFF